MDRAEEILTWYREFSPRAPEDVYAFFVFLTVPPSAPFPENLWNQQMCGVMWACSGPLPDAEAVVASARGELGTPALDWVAPMPHPALQGMFDGLYPPGDQWYWKADFFRELPDEAIAAHVQHAQLLPTWKSTMHLYPIDGCAGRVEKDATAWNFRDAKWAMVIVGVSPDPDDAPRLAAWTRAYWAALHRYSAGGAYVNMMMDAGDEGQDRVRAAYGDHYDRLARIKAEYDPDNLFHINQNIAPA
jgi:hypothetical protein